MSNTQNPLEVYEARLSEERAARSKARALALSSPDGFATKGLDDSPEYKDWRKKQDAMLVARRAIPAEDMPPAPWNW